MRSLRTVPVVLAALVLLAGCSRVLAALNGTETLREEAWTRSDGAACITVWTLTVISGLDTEDGPIGEVRDAFAEAEVAADDVEAARALLEAEHRADSREPLADDLLRFETHALAVAVHAAAVELVEAAGFGDDLDLYELGHAVDCG